MAGPKPTARALCVGLLSFLVTSAALLHFAWTSEHVNRLVAVVTGLTYGLVATWVGWGLWLRIAQDGLTQAKVWDVLLGVVLAAILVRTKLGDLGSYSLDDQASKSRLSSRFRAYPATFTLLQRVCSRRISALAIADGRSAQPRHVVTAAVTAG